MPHRRLRWRRVHIVFRLPLRSRSERLRRRCLLPHRRRRWRRVHIVFRLPLRSRRESLRRRIVLPFCLNRRWRTVIVRMPYRFRRSLAVITPAIEISSTTARSSSGLLINYLRIPVAINSPAIVVVVRLWRWIISPRHSRYVIVGVGALVASFSTGTPQRTLIAIAVSNSASNGASASPYRSARYGRWFVMISIRIAINDSPIRRRNWRTEGRRRIHPPRPAMPSVPTARRPAPAASVDEYPPAVAIRHPAPWIRRNPRITKARRVAPIAVAERVPVVANVIRLPDFAVSWDVIVLAVIIQVTGAVLIR